MRLVMLENSILVWKFKICDFLWKTKKFPIPKNVFTDLEFNWKLIERTRIGIFSVSVLLLLLLIHIKWEILHNRDDSSKDNSKCFSCHKFKIEAFQYCSVPPQRQEDTTVDDPWKMSSRLVNNGDILKKVEKKWKSKAANVTDVRVRNTRNFPSFLSLPPIMKFIWTLLFYLILEMKNESWGQRDTIPNNFLWFRSFFLPLLGNFSKKKNSTISIYFL